MITNKSSESAKVFLEKYMKERQDNPNVLNNYGAACLETNDLSQAIKAFRESIQMGLKSITTYTNLYFAKRLACDWSEEKGLNFFEAFEMEAKWDVSPFSHLVLEDCPRKQLRRARRYNDYLESLNPRPYKKKAFKKKNCNQKLNLAYVSADFHDFPGMHLMNGMFEFHDKEKFKSTRRSLFIPLSLRLLVVLFRSPRSLPGSHPAALS